MSISPASIPTATPPCMASSKAMPGPQWIFQCVPLLFKVNIHCFSFFFFYIARFIASPVVRPFFTPSRGHRHCRMGSRRPGGSGGSARRPAGPDCPRWRSGGHSYLEATGTQYPRQGAAIASSRHQPKTKDRTPSAGTVGPPWSSPEIQRNHAGHTARDPWVTATFLCFFLFFVSLQGPQSDNFIFFFFLQIGLVETTGGSVGSDSKQPWVEIGLLEPHLDLVVGGDEEQGPRRQDQATPPRGHLAGPARVHFLLFSTMKIFFF